MMHKIAQLVDSAGGLPREFVKKHNIKEVPISYTFDREQYFRENIDLSNCEFYERMRQDSNSIPLTSAPNIGEWLHAFDGCYNEGQRHLIVTTISSRLSASFQNACAARDIFLAKHQDSQVEVISSNSCACGQAAFEIHIARLIQSLVSWEELLSRAKSLVPGITTLFSVDDMTYMKAGGRIGGAAVFLGKLVNIKPVCEFRNGVVHPLHAVRGRKKSLTALVDIIAPRIKNANSAVFCIHHAICEEDASFLLQYLRKQLNFTGEVISGMLCAAVGAHSGPGAIGIGFVEV